MSINLMPPVLVPLEGQLNQIQELKDKWKKIPYAANSQSVANEAKKILARFNNLDSYKPSILSKLDNDAQSLATIQLIDSAFLTAMEQYKTDLVDATFNDFGIYMSPRDTALDFHYALAFGAARFAAKTPNIPIIKFFIGPLLSFIGAIYGRINQECITKEKMAFERSVYRQQWFDEVQVKEKQRVKQAIVLIVQRAKVIKQDIESIGSDLIDDDLVKEFIALDSLINFLSPETPLKVNGRTISEYLKDNNLELIDENSEIKLLESNKD